VIRSSATDTAYWEYHAVALERITVPAGGFDAFKVLGDGVASIPGDRLSLHDERWIDAASFLTVKAQTLFRNRRGAVVLNSGFELAELQRGAH
jgi:hypothetical protein